MSSSLLSPGHHYDAQRRRDRHRRRVGIEWAAPGLEREAAPVVSGTPGVAVTRAARARLRRASRAPRLERERQADDGALSARQCGSGGRARRPRRGRASAPRPRSARGHRCTVGQPLLDDAVALGGAWQPDAAVDHDPLAAPVAGTVRFRPNRLAEAADRQHSRSSVDTGRTVDLASACIAVPSPGVGLGVWRSLVARSVRVGEAPSSSLGTPMSTLVPLTSGYVALCAVQALTVLVPARRRA